MRISHRDLTDVHFQARCVMDLPQAEVLTGKRVLDLWCRKGKGVFAIAGRVGPDGAVIGVDSSAERIEAAWADISRARTDRWPREVRFACAHPDDLGPVGIEDASIGIVIVNAVLMLAPDVSAVLREIARVLEPQGILHCDVVLRADEAGLCAAGSQSATATAAGSQSATATAGGTQNATATGAVLQNSSRDPYDTGNVFLAAPGRRDFITCLQASGLSRVQVLSEEPVVPRGPDLLEQLKDQRFIYTVIEAAHK